MLFADNNVYRNLQEQVDKNKEDIENWLQRTGYKGPYTTIDDIPIADYADGQLYLVGTSNPYELYIWHTGAGFTDLGTVSQGPKGDKGDTGEKGEKGDKGDTGAQGPVGPEGPQGKTGPQGPQGVQGEKGDKGDKGDTGTLNSVTASVDQTVGTAKVTVTYDGANASFAFSGLKGEQGVQGVQGPQGEQGIQGIQGETGPQGPEGPQGPQGEKGETGEQGPKGDKGDTGPAGTYTAGTNINIANDEISVYDSPTFQQVIATQQVQSTGSINAIGNISTYDGNLTAGRSTIGAVVSVGTDTMHEHGTIKVSNSHASTPVSATLTLPETTGTLALTSDIPDVSNMVTTDTDQEITGKKTFRATVQTNDLRINSGDIKPLADNNSWCGMSGNAWAGITAYKLSDGTTRLTMTDVLAGAAAGATAVQPSSLATVATTGSYNDLSDKPTIPTVDVDKAYVDAELAKKQDTITDLDTIRSGAALGATALQAVPDTYALKTYVDEAVDGAESKAEAYTDDEVAKKQDTLTSDSTITVKQVNAETAAFTGNVGVNTFANIVDNAGNTIDGTYAKPADIPTIEANPSRTTTNTLSSIMINDVDYNIAGGSSFETIKEVDDLPSYDEAEANVIYKQKYTGDLCACIKAPAQTGNWGTLSEYVGTTGSTMSWEAQTSQKQWVAQCLLDGFGVEYTAEGSNSYEIMNESFDEGVYFILDNLCSQEDDTTWKHTGELHCVIPAEEVDDGEEQLDDEDYIVLTYEITVINGEDEPYVNSGTLTSVAHTAAITITPNENYDCPIFIVLNYFIPLSGFSKEATLEWTYITATAIVADSIATRANDTAAEALDIANNKSQVSVSSSGSSTAKVGYITVNGIEYKLSDKDASPDNDTIVLNTSGKLEATIGGKYVEQAVQFVSSELIWGYNTQYPNEFAGNSEASYYEGLKSVIGQTVDATFRCKLADGSTVNLAGKVTMPATYSDYFMDATAKQTDLGVTSGTRFQIRPSTNYSYLARPTTQPTYNDQLVTSITVLIDVTATVAVPIDEKWIPSTIARTSAIPTNYVTTNSDQTISAKKTWYNSNYSTYIQPNAIGISNGTSSTTITSSNITVDGMKIENGAFTYNSTEFELPGTKSGSDTIAMISDIPDVSSFITKDVNDLTNYTKTSALAKVATSGSYNDLSNKPSVVTTSGAQTIAGTKTFSSAIVAPNLPTPPTAAGNYVLYCAVDSEGNVTYSWHN